MDSKEVKAKVKPKNANQTSLSSSTTTIDISDIIGAFIHTKKHTGKAKSRFVPQGFKD
jgi:hypothetical protein